jgi:hypothetical protein
MTRTAFLLTLIVAVLASMPAHAQFPLRVFVSAARGLDTNPCTVTQPCRTFQQAFNTMRLNGEIDVLDPGGYGPLNITGGGINIQAHGFGGITQPASCAGCAAISVNVTNGNPVTLNGLLLDGAGLGWAGIYITEGSSVTILNSVVHHFQFGIAHGSITNGANLLIEDTVASDNADTGISVGPTGSNATSTLNRITANNNQIGVASGSGTTWLAKSMISGNGIGVCACGATVNSFGDNYITGNGVPVQGFLTPVTTQ